MLSASSRLRPPCGGNKRIVVSLNSSAVTPPIPKRMAVPSGSRCIPEDQLGAARHHLLNQETLRFARQSCLWTSSAMEVTRAAT